MVTNSLTNELYKNKAFNAGLNVALGISPLLPKSASLCHGILQTGKFISSRIHRVYPLSSSLPPGVLTDRALFGEAFIQTFDRILARRLAEATLCSIAHNLIHGALLQGGEQSTITRFSEQFGIQPMAKHV